MNPDFSLDPESFDPPKSVEPDAFQRLSEEQFSQTLEELADIIKCLGTCTPAKDEQK
jgi:hypothetical protein